MCLSSKQDETKSMLRKSICTHTHTCAHLSEQDRKYKYCGKHTLHPTNNCTTRHTKEKFICAYMLRKYIRLLPKPREHSVSLKKQSAHACKKSRREGKKSCQKQKVCLSLLKCHYPLITKLLPHLIK